MLVKLTEVGRLGGMNEINPGYHDLDSSWWIALGGEMIFKKDVPTPLFVGAAQIHRVIRVEIPVYKWTPKYASEEEMKAQVPWWKRLFKDNLMYEGTYEVIEKVPCTKVKMASGVTYLVAETPEEIIEMQSKAKDAK